MGDCGDRFQQKTRDASKKTAGQCYLTLQIERLCKQAFPKPFLVAS